MKCWERNTHPSVIPITCNQKQLTHMCISPSCLIPRVSLLRYDRGPGVVPCATVCDRQQRVQPVRVGGSSLGTHRILMRKEEEEGGRRRKKGGGREGEARGDMYPFGGTGVTHRIHIHIHIHTTLHTRATTHKTTVVVRLRATQKGAAQITRVTLKKKTLYYIRRNDTWSCSVCVYSIPASNE